MKVLRSILKFLKYVSISFGTLFKITNFHPSKSRRYDELYEYYNSKHSLNKSPKRVEKK